MLQNIKDINFIIIASVDYYFLVLSNIVSQPLGQYRGSKITNWQILIEGRAGKVITAEMYLQLSNYVYWNWIFETIHNKLNHSAIWKIYRSVLLSLFYWTNKYYIYYENNTFKIRKVYSVSIL